MRDDGRFLIHIGQGHRLGISIEDQILCHGPTRLGGQRCDGQALLVPRLHGGVRIPHIDDEQLRSGPGDEVAKLLGRCDASLTLLLRHDGGVEAPFADAGDSPRGCDGSSEVHVAFAVGLLPWAPALRLALVANK